MEDLTQKQELILLLEIIMGGPKGYCGDHYVYTPQLNADSVNEIHAELVASEQSDASQQAQDSCFWELDDSEGCYNTKCGNAFWLEEGTPKENDFKYCCYCGGRLAD